MDRSLALSLLAILAACDGRYELRDPDGDGLYWPEDCDDHDASIPGDGGLCTSAAAATLFGHAHESAGWAVAAGDADGDGQADLAVVASDQEPVFYLVSGPVSGELSLADAQATLVGQHNSTNSGVSLAAAGDVDGDGYEDFVLGEPDQEEGRVFVLRGPLEGGGTLDEVATVVHGDGNCGEAGFAVMGLGDVNGDGLDDIAVGDPYYSSDEGRVFLLHGPVEGITTLSHASYQLYDGGGMAWVGGDQAGYALTRTGDVDGDGYADILVGAPGWDAEEDLGLAYLVLGPVREDMSLDDGETTFRSDAGEGGEAVAGAGDMNGDGYGDLAIGAPGTGGTVCGYVFYWPTSSIEDLEEADLTLIAAEDSTYAGAAMVSVGDLDQDGLDDLAIGAPGSTHSAAAPGAVYVVFGGSEGTIDLEEAEGLILGSSESGWADNLGYALAATGDIDGDGRTELLVGAPGHEEEGVQAGAAYLFSGASLAR